MNRSLPDLPSTPPEAHDDRICPTCDGTCQVEDETGSFLSTCEECSGEGTVGPECQCHDCQQAEQDRKDDEGQRALEDAHARGLIRED